MERWNKSELMKKIALEKNPDVKRSYQFVFLNTLLDEAREELELDEDRFKNLLIIVARYRGVVE